MKLRIGIIVLAGMLAGELAGAGAGKEVESAAPSWRTRYTLGAGDVLNLGVYGRPDLAHTQVTVQPDGNVSFLQVNVQAEGLSIDELRTKLESALAEFYKHPRVIVSPAELRSKKYFIIAPSGSGAYTMDRPVTILDALARSRREENDTFSHGGSGTADFADLSHAVLIRHGKRLPVNIDALLLKGDLRQNIEIEPGDYIYIAGGGVDEVYVLGEVAAPGVQNATSPQSVISAITARGGFTKSAFRQRVLVVRGSLSNPRTFVVNTNATLKGRKADFALEPKDIVFVSARPWEFAEELTDSAVNAFTTGFISAWT
jgi:polysaccharide export outer membrane protein